MPAKELPLPIHKLEVLPAVTALSLQHIFIPRSHSIPGEMLLSSAAARLGATDPLTDSHRPGAVRVLYID